MTTMIKSRWIRNSSEHLYDDCYCTSIILEVFNIPTLRTIHSLRMIRRAFQRLLMEFMPHRPRSGLVVPAMCDHSLVIAMCGGSSEETVPEFLGGGKSTVEIPRNATPPWNSIVC